MAEVEIRPARPDDLPAFAVETKSRTIRAVVATVDGRPMGIAGVAYHPRNIIAFSEMHEELRPYLAAIVAMRRAASRIFAGVAGPVVAVKDASIPGSDAFLAWCGFSHLNSGPEGEVYIWKQC